MQVDSEINIAHEWRSVTQGLRRRLWDLHTCGKGAQDTAEEAFLAWKEIITVNKRRQRERRFAYASLIDFYFGEASLVDMD